MAAGKYIDMVGGVQTQKQASDSSAGAGDAGKLVALNDAGEIDETMFPGNELIEESAGAGDAGKVPKLDSTGKFDPSLMPVGTSVETDVATATEDLAAGDLVNVYSSSGIKVRKADATSAGKEANGFVLASVTSGNPATVYRASQSDTQLSGLTPGAKYYLSTTAGGVTATAPSGSGNVVQSVGFASSSTSLSFMPGDPVVLA